MKYQELSREKLENGKFTYIQALVSCKDAAEVALFSDAFNRVSKNLIKVNEIAEKNDTSKKYSDCVNRPAMFWNTVCDNMFTIDIFDNEIYVTFHFEHVSYHDGWTVREDMKTVYNMVKLVMGRKVNKINHFVSNEEIKELCNTVEEVEDDAILMENFNDFITDEEIKELKEMKETFDDITLDELRQFNEEIEQQIINDEMVNSFEEMEKAIKEIELQENAINEKSPYKIIDTVTTSNDIIQLNRILDESGLYENNRGKYIITVMKVEETSNYISIKVDNQYKTLEIDYYTTVLEIIRNINDMIDFIKVDLIKGLLSDCIGDNFEDIAYMVCGETKKIEYYGMTVTVGRVVQGYSIGVQYGKFIGLTLIKDVVELANTQFENMKILKENRELQ